MPSFTIQVPNIRETGPIVEVGITVGSVIEDIIKESGQIIPLPFQTLAMIDTGASKTVIQEDVVKQLNLNPTGVMKITTASHVDVECYKYIVKILFPNNVIFETSVVAVPLSGQNIHCLIGRDILGFAVFIYNGYTNSFTLSF